MSNGSLLWVDDKIGGLDAFVNALAAEGFSVTTADGTLAAVSCAEKQSFDICLVDIYMPELDGIECLRRLHAKMPKAKFAALSSYLYKPRYKDELRTLNFPVQLLEKNSDAPNSPDFRAQFIEPILKLANAGVTTTIQTQDNIEIDTTERDPFQIPLAEFNALPLVTKDRIRLLAGKIAHKHLERAFAAGKLWVMLCGDPSVIRASATSPTEMWDEDKIMEFGRIQQRVPYIFWNDVNVDEIVLEEHWAPCGGETGPSYYPTVTLEFGKTSIRVHFDTGAPLTFFSYEALVELEAIRPTTLFGQKRRKNAIDAEYWATPLNIKARIKCQHSGETLEVDIRGQAVRDWEMAPFKRFCGAHCPVPALNGVIRLCPDRNALIGRNVLIENALILVLDGKNKRTLLR